MTTQHPMNLQDALASVQRQPAPDASKRIERLDAKILTIDIERVPGMALLFDPRVRSGYIQPSSFTEEPATICAAFKWYGRSKVEFTSVWGDGYNTMIQRLWDAYDQADIVVTYNGKRFDNKCLNTDWLTAGLPEPSPRKDVDLLQQVRKKFQFNSYRLDEVCAALGVTRKTGKYNPREAIACIQGDTKAQARMARYNRGDVRATEALYDRVRGWMHTHPHVSGLPADATGEPPTCNQCGSLDLTREGTYLASVIAYAAYRCNNCGANTRAGHHHRQAHSRGVGPT